MRYFNLKVFNTLKYFTLTFPKQTLTFSYSFKNSSAQQSKQQNICIYFKIELNNSKQNMTLTLKGNTGHINYISQATVK